MTADRWTQAVRQQLKHGRLLPLGGPGDGAWITEAAAAAVLRRAVRQVPYVRLGALRLALADPDTASEPAVPPPPSALPPGPLRITADFAASPAEPFPTTASLLRATLTATAVDALGLRVTEVDLRVTGLLDEDPSTPDEDGADEEAEDEEADGHRGEPRLRLDDEESRVADAVRSVPGVTRLGAVHITHPTDSTAAAALPRRHVTLEIETAPPERTLHVTRVVRANTTAALPDHPSAAVLVTAVTPAAL